MYGYAEIGMPFPAATPARPDEFIIALPAYCRPAGRGAGSNPAYTVKHFCGEDAEAVAMGTGWAGPGSGSSNPERSRAGGRLVRPRIPEAAGGEPAVPETVNGPSPDLLACGLAFQLAI